MYINYMGGGIFRISLLLVKVECMGGYPLKYFYSLYIYWIEGFFFFLNKYMLTFLILSYRDRFMCP